MTQSWADAAAGFDFEAMLRQSLAGDLAAMNACVECCDAHAAADPERVALRYESRDSHGGTMTFGALKEAAGRFANLLAARGIGPGDRVGGLLPRVPELLVTILGLKCC